MRVQCPYCGETVTVLVDEGVRGSEREVEDCEVCCRPMEVLVRRRADGTLAVEVRRGDD